jgi:hypothetical protein
VLATHHLGLEKQPETASYQILVAGFCRQLVTGAALAAQTEQLETALLGHSLVLECRH